MDMTKGQRKWLHAALLPFIVLCFGIIFWAIVVFRTHFQLEDALITFRYSANILNGNGFVFNPGERVLGTTTPLETLLLALLSWPFGYHSIPTVASIITPIFGLLAGVVLFASLTKKGIAIPAAAFGMILYYSHIEPIRTGVGGMETPIVLFLMAASLWTLINRKPAALGVILGLLVLCRIDGLIWTSLVFITAFLQWRKDVWRTIGSFAIVVLPWVIFAFIYFGNPLPNSMLAKGVVRPGEADNLLNPVRIDKYIKWFVMGAGVEWNRWFMPLWILALVAGAKRIIKAENKGLRLLILFPVVYAAAMYFGRAPRFEWYLMPITFPCLFIGAIGIYEVVISIFQSSSSRLALAVPYLLIAAVIVGSIIYMPAMLYRLGRIQRNEDGLRKTVGLWLKNNTPPDSSAAMEAIGYQGYYSERRIIDLAGLVSPRVVGYQKRTAENGQVFDWILRDMKPDYIVLRSFEVDSNHHFNGGKLFLTSEKEEAFKSEYKEVKRFHAPTSHGSELVRHLTIYQRIK